MSATVESLAAEALQLSETERVRLIELLATAPPAEPLSPEWTAEIERRVAQLDAGVGESFSVDEVLAEMQALIAARR